MSDLGQMDGNGLGAERWLSQEDWRMMGFRMVVSCLMDEVREAMLTLDSGEGRREGRGWFDDNDDGIAPKQERWPSRAGGYL